MNEQFPNVAPPDEEDTVSYEGEIILYLLCEKCQHEWEVVDQKRQTIEDAWDHIVEDGCPKCDREDDSGYVDNDKSRVL